MKQLICIFTIIILSAQDSTLTLWHDSEQFTIDSQDPNITWEYPNGSEQFDTGETISATWSASDNSFTETPIQIFISPTIGSEFTELTEFIENTQTMNLSLPDEDLKYVQLKATAVDSFGNISSDYSDGYFTIGNPITPGTQDSTLVLVEPSNTTIIDSKNPVVELNTPNGGEQFESEETITVEWTATDDQFGETPIEISQSLGIGSEFNLAFESVENTGNINSTLPNINEPFSRFKITATDIFGNYSTDYSDGYFSIGEIETSDNSDTSMVVLNTSNTTTIDSQNPILELYTPNGGSDEIFYGGSDINVTWYASDNSFGESPISLKLANFIGEWFLDVAVDIPNTEDYNILAPDTTLGFVRMRITAIDDFGNITMDESDDYFQVIESGLFNEDNHPIEFSLSPAYPNPFNPLTTLDYALPFETNVNIVIYDIQGRKVAQLVNNIQTMGTYSVTWNAGNQHSGMYFVKMITGNVVKTQKLMLIK